MRNVVENRAESWWLGFTALRQIIFQVEIVGFLEADETVLVFAPQCEV
jgi:hypothetical protein